MPKFYKPTFPLFIFLFIFSNLWASSIKGRVTDAKTGEPLTGASVSLKNTSYNTVAGLDGSFEFRNVPAGTYSLVSHFVGYTVFENVVVLTDHQQLVSDIVLAEDEKQLSEIVVTGDTLDRVP
jgi:hypothetical protein